MPIDPATFGALAGAQVGGSVLEGIINYSRTKRFRKRVHGTELGIQRLADDLYRKQEKEVRPYAELGRESLSRFRNRLETGQYNTRVDLYKDPSYQFRRREGLRAIRRQASARGQANSGVLARAQAHYTSGLASQEYNAAFGRAQSENDRRYERDAGAVQTGLGASQLINAYGAQRTQEHIQSRRNMVNAYQGQYAASSQGFSNLFDEANDVAKSWYQQPAYDQQGDMNQILTSLLHRQGTLPADQDAPL